MIAVRFIVDGRLEGLEGLVGRLDAAEKLIALVDANLGAIDVRLAQIEARLDGFAARLDSLESSGGAGPSNAVDAGVAPHDVRALWRGTQLDYDTLNERSETKLYLIMDEGV